jgi:nicotinamidase-related amidase
MDALKALKTDPASTALLVVDVQEKLLPAMPTFAQARLMACTDLLLEAARLFAVRVAITEQYPKGLGHSMAALLDAVARFDSASRPVIIEKTVFSAADVEAVQSALSGVRSVIVLGVEAHVCVYQTVRTLLERGFAVNVVSDAVASRDEECKRVALESMARAGATITSAECVVFDWLSDAKHPHFKALSAKVKALPLKS